MDYSRIKLQLGLINQCYYEKTPHVFVIFFGLINYKDCPSFNVLISSELQKVLFIMKMCKCQLFSAVLL